MGRFVVMYNGLAEVLASKTTCLVFFILPRPQEPAGRPLASRFR